MTTAYLRTDIPDIRPGDTVRVRQNVQEGDKKRIASFEGIVIARKHGKGITGTMTVRKVVDGIGVERIFPLHAPTIKDMTVTRRATRVRRAKLYFIRERAARDVRRKMRALAIDSGAKNQVVPATIEREEKRES